jgi:HSP90 family molecular chaperone
MSSPTSKYVICFEEPWQLILAFASALNVFAQFTCRVWHPTEKDHFAWSSTNLEAFEVDEATKRDFTSDKVKLTLSEDLTTYTFTVSVNPKTVIDVPTQL